MTRRQRRHRRHISATGCPWILPLADALGPPGEQGRRANEVRAGLQCDTALRLGIVQLLDAGEMVVSQRGIGERPQMLCRLQLGRVRRQEQQVGAIRFPETASRQGMGSTPQGVTTCCPMSGAIPDPLGEGGTKSVFPTVATGPQSVKREEKRPHRDLDSEQPPAGRHGERKRTLR
jgi:hypothetical protein